MAWMSSFVCFCEFTAARKALGAVALQTLLSQVASCQQCKDYLTGAAHALQVNGRAAGSVPFTVHMCVTAAKFLRDNDFFTQASKRPRWRTGALANIRTNTTPTVAIHEPKWRTGVLASVGAVCYGIA